MGKTPSRELTAIWHWACGWGCGDVSSVSHYFTPKRVSQFHPVLFSKIQECKHGNSSFTESRTSDLFPSSLPLGKWQSIKCRVLGRLSWSCGYKLLFSVLQLLLMHTITMYVNPFSSCRRVVLWRCCVFFYPSGKGPKTNCKNPRFSIK